MADLSTRADAGPDPMPPAPPSPDPAAARRPEAARPHSGGPLESLAWLLPVLAAALVYGWIAWDAEAGSFSDSVDYLLLADSIRRDVLGLPAEPALRLFHLSRFPPLYPALLALIGAGPDAQARAFALTAALGVAAVGLCALWSARVTRSKAAGAAIAATLPLCPGLFLVMVHGPLSEPLLAVLVIAMLLFSERLPQRSAAWAVAALAGAAPLARNIGFAFSIAAAAVLWRELRLSRAYRLSCAALCLLPLPLWSLLRHSPEHADSYLASLRLEKLLASFGGWHGWLLLHPLRILDSAALLWVNQVQPVHGVLLIPLALASFVGCLRRIAERKIDAIALPIYLAVICVWPFPAELSRLLSALIPIVVVHAWAGAMQLPRRVRPLSGRTLALVVASAFAVLGIDQSLALAHRALRPVESGLETYKRTPGYFWAPTDAVADRALAFHASLIGILREIRAVVPARGECVYTIMPSMVWLYARVPALPIPLGLTEPAAAKARFTACRYFLVGTATTLQSAEAPLYPLPLIEAWTETLRTASMPAADGDTELVLALLRRRDSAERSSSSAAPGGSLEP